MRVHVSLALTACGLWLAAAGIAVAQGAHININGGGVGVDINAQGIFRGEGQIVRATNLIGLSVYNASHESLGKIEDFVVAPQSGRIRYAVLSFGGILGLGDKYFAVPWDKLAFVSKGETSAGTPKEEYCVLDVSKETLKNAPGFNKHHWPNVADRSWRRTIEQYYKASRETPGERSLRR